ncbi:MAG TPA: MrpF/PhaF family protein [Tepidisphaeraceae bacterium]|jgi:multicomponent Na+:H+ antiporter subunit F
MNIWLWAGAGMLFCLMMLTLVCFRGEIGDRLVGLEMAGCLASLTMVLLIEGFKRPSFYDLPLTLALLSFGSGMVFARFVQRWL